MGESSEVYLQKLIEEEKVIKSALKLVKSRFLQLQVEHMGLKIAQRKLLLRCQNAYLDPKPVGDVQSQEELSDQQKEQFCIKNSRASGDVKLSLSQHIEEITGNSVSDNNPIPTFSEKELDDPGLMNKMELDLSMCLGTSSASENRLYDEQSLRMLLEGESEDEG